VESTACGLGSGADETPSSTVVVSTGIAEGSGPASGICKGDAGHVVGPMMIVVVIEVVIIEGVGLKEPSVLRGEG
jgi:hypothetical protein